MKRVVLSISILIATGSILLMTGCGGGGANNSNASSDLTTKPKTDFTVFKRGF